MISRARAQVGNLMKSKTVDMRKGVLLISNQKVSKRDKERFGLQYFEDEGWEVAHCDVNELLDAVHQSDENKTLQDIKNGKFGLVLDNALNGPSLSQYWKRVYLLILVRLSARRVIYDCGLLPEPIRVQEKRTALRRICVNVYKSIVAFPWRLLKADACVAGGDILAVRRFYKHKIRGCSFDYERCVEHNYYLDNSGKELVNHGLYLEQGMHDCADHRLWGRRWPIEREPMLEELALGLASLANRSLAPVAVKRHPGTNANDFEEPRFIQDRRDTAAAVNHSRFIITHYSTAISYAVVMRKPIIFWITEQQVRNCSDPYIKDEIVIGKRMWGLLGSSMLVCPERLQDVDMEAALEIDVEKYKKYEIDYIKCEGSLDIQNSKKVISYFEQGNSA